MAKNKRSSELVNASQLEGFKYLKLISELFETLHDDGTLRDKAGNRELHFDQYAMLMLLYFFNPILTSLRGTQEQSRSNFSVEFAPQSEKVVDIRHRGIGNGE